MSKELENLLEDLDSGEEVKTKYGVCYAYSPDVVEELRQALLGAQEQGKINAYVEKIKTMMKQKVCVLRYVESEDCFAVKTMLSGWYKLTPEFVENNVREEIKPLPLIEKNRQLREENAELKRVLEIIKKKGFDRSIEDYDNYNIWVEYKVEQFDKAIEKNPTILNWDVFDKFTYTQEEFDLLKRWENGKRI